MKTLIELIKIITVLAICVVAYLFVQVQSKKIRYEAIDACLQASEYSFSESTGATIRTPVDKNVQDCLKLKGIK